jgi:hypothetical protein
MVAGIIGVRPLAAAEYASGPVQDNTGTLNYLVQPARSRAGTSNTVRSLTFGAGGTLTQSPGQTLLIGATRSSLDPEHLPP